MKDEFEGYTHPEDAMIDKLGNYFVYHQLRERYGWTFEQFVDKVKSGAWTAIHGDYVA